MDEIFTNYNGIDYNINYILKKRPYIWGFYKNNENINFILTANINDDINVSFSKILIELPLIIEQTVDNVVGNPKEFSEYILTHNGNEIKLNTENFRYLQSRSDAHSFMVEHMKNIANKWFSQ